MLIPHNSQTTSILKPNLYKYIDSQSHSPLTRKNAHMTTYVYLMGAVSVIPIRIFIVYINNYKSCPDNAQLSRLPPFCQFGESLISDRFSLLLTALCWRCSEALPISKSAATHVLNTRITAVHMFVKPTSPWVHAYIPCSRRSYLVKKHIQGRHFLSSAITTTNVGTINLRKCLGKSGDNCCALYRHP
jgi:hypothetical protein